MGYLKHKIIKIKKIQKIGKSLAVLLPSNWLYEMNWSRETILKMVWHPENNSIIIEKNEIPNG